MTDKTRKPLKLRSQNWFGNPGNADLTALYLERYLNYGFTRGELQGGKPIIGIAQTDSDLSPCNRAHVDLVKRVKDGITAAEGVPLEFPVHPIQEGPDAPIVRYRFHTYNPPGTHWSERQKRERLFQQA